MNMVDYLRWRGDLTFAQDPFNEVDNLILAYITYSDLDGIAPFEGEISLADATRAFFSKYDEKAVRESHIFTRMAPFVMRDAAATKRFEKCTISKYVSSIDKETTEQFCAMHIKCDDGTTYIGFRGTDDTAIGWHEDFQLAYKTISAQIKAKEYLNSTMSVLKKYRVGGHSKGGNLAEFASIMCDRKLQNRILNVYTNDGPGISDEIFESEEYARISDRIIKIMPKFDVFGVLFNSPKMPIIIDSNEFAIMQHDPMSWSVEGKSFVGEKMNRICENFGESLNDFLRAADSSRKELFVSQLFKAFDEAHINHLSDFSQDSIRTVIRFLQQLGTIDDNSREFASGLLKVVLEVTDDEVDAMVDSAKGHISEKIEPIRKRFSKKAKD